MDYVSTINLIPALGNDYNSSLELAQEVVERTHSQKQTIAFSVDDALSLASQGLAGSTIKMWGVRDMKTHDVAKLKESDVYLEYWHFRNQIASWIYLQNVLPSSEPHYPKRTVATIDTITIHHSVGWIPGWTNEANVVNIANYHVNTKGWPGIGYHFIVAPNGEILQTNHIETKSNHVAGENHRTIGVCYGGDFRYLPPTQAAIYAGQALVGELKLDLPNMVAIKPHKRMHNASTACPGYALENWLKIVAN